MPPRIISFNELPEECPRRESFYSDKPKATERVLDALSKQHANMFPLIFPTTVTARDVSTGDTSEAVLHVHGVMPDGSTAFMTVNNLDLFFHVKLTKTITKTRVLSIIDTYTTCRIDKKKLFKTFLRSPIEFLYVRFATIRDYQAAILKCHEEDFETFSDDYDNLPNKFARETNITFGDWNIIYDFEVDKKKLYSPLSQHAITASIDNVHVYTGQRPPLLTKDRSVVMTTDCEMYAGNIHKDFVSVDNRLDILKSIAGSFHWVNDSEPFFTYAISAQDCELCDNLLRYDNLLIVQCKSEAEVLLAWGYIRGAINPQFHLDFNGGDFDTPWIVERSKQLGILWEVYSNYANTYTRKADRTDDWVYKRAYSGGRGRKIKVENGVDSYMKDLQAPGCINIDVMLVFKNIHSHDDVVSHSLNDFLAINNLGSKVGEMTYELMDQIFQNGTKAQMGEVLYYNIVDSIKCQELMVKRNLYAGYRAMTKVAMVTIYNSVYNAGGMKCVNMVFAKAFEMGYLMTNFTKEVPPDGKFGGAYVPKPEVGPSKRPAGSVDYKSLYPSIIRAFNVSGEQIVKDLEDIKWLTEQGERLVERDYLFMGQEKRCHIIQHNNDPKKMGVLGQVVDGLFDKRDSLKAVKSGHAKTLKEMEITGDNITEKSKYESVKFLHDLADAEQLAVKILMNTIYGKAGDSGHMNEADENTWSKHIGYNTSSQLYVMDVSSSITAYGQQLIKYVHRRLEEEGCKSKYGDTDSVYFTMNDSYYLDLDRKYNNREITKLEYWTSLVVDSIGYMDTLCRKINKELVTLTSGPFIKLATEGVKWPVIFTGKKKYIGIEHLDSTDVRFDIDYSDYMLKGIEAKKRGNAEVLKILTKDIIVEMMSIENPRDMPDIDTHGIVKKHISRLYNEDWDIEYFVKIARYKRSSANTARPFVERMQIEYDQESEIMQVDPNHKRLYYVPSNQAKFKYAVVVKPDDFDFNGNVVKRNQDWYMEYPEVIKALGYKLDLNKFVESNILTPCARFIVHDPDFWINANGVMVEDATAIKNAGKYLKGFIQQFTPTPFKNSYTYTAVRNTRRKLMNIGTNKSEVGIVQNPTINVIMQYAEEQCINMHDPHYGREYVKRVRKTCDLFQLYTHMNPTRARAFSLYREKMKLYEEREHRCCDVIQGIANRLHGQTEDYLEDVNKYVMALGSSLDNMSETLAKKSRAGLTDESIRRRFLEETAEDYELLDEAVNELIGIKMCKHNLSEVITALQAARNTINNMIEAPVGFKPPLIKA
jgi:DNA polymerase elongation subunit (family B)